MKILEILALRKLFVELKDLQVPNHYRLFYQMAKFLHSTDTEAEFYQKEYNKIIEAYAERNEDNSLVTVDNNQIKLKVDTQQECIVAITSLEQTEFDVSYQLKLHDDDLEVMNLTPQQIYLLMPYIIEE